MSEKPTVQTKAELLRTIASVVQVVLALTTLIILVVVHFL